MQCLFDEPRIIPPAYLALSIPNHRFYSWYGACSSNNLCDIWWNYSISYTKSCLSQIMSYYSLPVLRWQWNKAYTAILAVDVSSAHLGRGAGDLSSRRRHTKCHYSACFVTSFLSFATSSRYEDWDETPLTHLVLLHLRLQITQIPE